MSLHSRGLLSLILIPLLVAPAWPQDTSGPKQNLVQEGGGLKLVVVEGEGALNNVRTKSAVAPVVEVRDDQDKPVAGAEVVFQLPAAGPGGVFSGWMRSQTARTNAQGQAGVTGFTPNDEEGRFNIKVTATAGKRTASVVIAQSNTRTGSQTPAQAKSARRGWWILGGVIAAAIAGGAYAASRTGNSTAATAVTNPVTIIAGPVSVGGPR